MAKRQFKVYPLPTCLAYAFSDLTSLAPTIQQGGGQIDAYRLVRSKVQVFPNRFQLNHTGAGALRTRFDLTVKNNGPVAITYQVNHLPSASVYVYSAEKGDWGQEFPPTLVKDIVATIDFAWSNFTVNPGASRVLRFQIVVPTGFVEDRLPIISGFVSLVGSNGETISVPYAGMYLLPQGSPKKLPIQFLQLVYISSNAVAHFDIQL